MPGPAAGSIGLLLMLAAGSMGQTAPAPAVGYPDTESAIESLHQISTELTASVRVYYADIGETILKRDHGYQPANAPRVQGADTGLASGPADAMWSAARKLASFRLLAIRDAGAWKPGDEPPAVRDLDRIQNLIMEVRRRVDGSTVVLRRLLVVPVTELDGRRGTAAKAKREHNAFLKAREAAVAAAMQALAILPIDQRESGSHEDRARKAWDRLGSKHSAGAEDPQGASDPATSLPAPTPAIPIRLEPRNRVTLVREPSYRIAITDSGIEDENGRHVFYQEEWTQRASSVTRYRWRVAVDMKTGQHVLLRRYPVIELDGFLDDVYRQRDHNYLWSREPLPGAGEPPRDKVESALAEVVSSREAIKDAARSFHAGIRDALAQQDRFQMDSDQPVVDNGLPDRLREALFAIRAHMARVMLVIHAENEIRQATENAEEAIRSLEPLAAWANKQDFPESPPPLEWVELLNRSSREIDLTRAAESEGLDALPPDHPKTEDRFPSLAKNTIVRIRGAHSKDNHDGAAHCLEEVWRLEYGAPGTREVVRVVSLIQIDPQTGRQTRERSNSVTYKLTPGDLLESIFDEYSADEVKLGGG